MSGLAGMAGAVPGLSGDILGISDILKGAGSLASLVPTLLAATGNKKAGSFLAEQASIDCTKAGGEWLNNTCDMTAVIAAKQEAARSQAVTDQIKAYAPWVAIGVVGLGPTYATIRAFSGGQA